MTLKSFIKAVGLVVWALGIGVAAFFDLGFLRYFLGADRIGWGLFFGVILFTGVGTCIAWVGWRIFRRWDRASVREYIDVQSLLTGIAVGKVTALWSPDLAAVAGVVAFLAARGLLRGLLPQVLGLPREHSRRGVEMAHGDETRGTPWQNDPGHTKA